MMTTTVTVVDGADGLTPDMLRQRRGCPECDALVEEAMQWRDWQSLEYGVYCYKHEPENVETK